MTGTCEYCGKKLCVICGCCNCEKSVPPLLCVHTEEQRRTAERKCLECGTTEDVHEVRLMTTMLGFLCVKCMKEKYTRMKVYTAVEIMAKNHEVEEWKNSSYRGEVAE